MYNDSTEKDPTQRHSPEDAGWSHGEYGADDLNKLYGFESSEPEDGDIAVDNLGQRIDQRQVSFRVDGDTQLSQHDKESELDETGLEVDTQATQYGANEQLAKLGLADRPETTVSHRDAANETVAEALVDGQDEFGRLDDSDRRDAQNAAIATELDKTLRRGETESLQYLPPSSAAKVAAWLGNIGERYGAAEFAPQDEVAAVGAYITFAEKVSDVANSETIVSADPASGEVIAESMDDAVMRVLDGDPEPEAAKLLSPEQYSMLKAKQDDLELQHGRFYSPTIDHEDQEALVDQARKVLLAANAERMAG